ncbi:helix-turn-helix transcriptional regulator [Clostridium sp. AN503]|uniref:helix-turn-helix domain-containing protein n=1 Tax=Clostridium sp. AN503 TaxID=3160598 RepID=UPI00345A8FBF
MGLGTKLKKLLSEKNMTVAELSRLTGVSTNTLYAVIRRDSDKMSGDALIKVSKILEVPISSLLADNQFMLMLDDDGNFHNIDENATGLEPAKNESFRYLQKVISENRAELTLEQKQELIKALLSNE